MLFSRDSAWWAYRRASKLSYIRYQDMAPVLREVWQPLEEELFATQADVEQRALELFKQDPDLAEAFLTEYSLGLAKKTAERYWLLGDRLWVRFNNWF